MIAGLGTNALEQPSATLGESRRRELQWTKGRKALFGSIGFGAIVIAAVGFVGSYASVRDLAERKGFGWFADVFPLGIDIGIAVLLALDLALTWIDLPFPLLRHIAWMLTAATIAFNGAASWPDLVGSAMHGVIPLLFIAITEAVRSAVAQAMELDDSGRRDSIPLSRWLLSPAATWSIWRDMRLWRIPSYRVALTRYQNRRLYEQELRSQHGRRWRSKASADDLRPLRQARLGIAVTDSAPPADTAAAVEERPADVTTGRPLPQPELPQTPAPALEPAGPAPLLPHHPLPAAPEPQMPVEPAHREETVAPAEPKPRLEAATPAQSPAEPAAGPQETLTPPAGTANPLAQQETAPLEPATPAADEEHGNALEHDAQDDEPADEHPAGGGDAQESDEAPGIDVGLAQPGETKSQRAERIYLAHQEAGVELKKPDLARWAGYKQEGSGRTQYAKLEKLHGPIIIREGTDQLNLEWQQQDNGLPS
ncbi:DUF2637 domain-containing protein [Streptomyces sp. NPDC020667]|uniref:DUF2637 domain-containing protein n=1 Tax=Streptomyces sp. NPDC020667 TaxID=3154895 RepID=UPI00340D9B05